MNAEVLTLFNSSFDEPESTKPLRAPISQGKKKSSSKELNLVHCQYDLIKIKMLFLTFKLEKKKNSLKIESKDFKEKGKKGW